MALFSIKLISGPSSSRYEIAVYETGLAHEKLIISSVYQSEQLAYVAFQYAEELIKALMRDYIITERGEAT